ncbi:MAG TPA: bile acid:sodium symporter, partial [Candidatus Cybelea sp.]|nr:bile acid:sodium symporter [Candidatus Cybelea sp.]
MAAIKAVALLMLISLTLGAGLQVNFDHLIATLKNIPLLAKALIANFVIVPILGVLLARLFALPEEIATGFLLMAIAPGVPFVLASVRKRGGSLGLAIELAAVLPLVSIVTVPLTAHYVLPTAEAAQLPLGHFVVTLVLFQLLPLLIGITIGTTLPNIAPRLSRIAQIVFL